MITNCILKKVFTESMEPRTSKQHIILYFELFLGLSIFSLGEHAFLVCLQSRNCYGLCCHSNDAGPMLKLPGIGTCRYHAILLIAVVWVCRLSIDRYFTKNVGIGNAYNIYFGGNCKLNWRWVRGGVQDDLIKIPSSSSFQPAEVKSSYKFDGSPGVGYWNGNA